MADEKFIESPPAGLEGWREVWRTDLRYRPQHRGPFYNLLHRLFRWGGHTEHDRQLNFNLAALQLVDDVRSDVAALRADLQRIQNEVARDLGQLQQDSAATSEQLSRDVARIEERVPIVGRRNDALVSALDQKVENLASRLRDLTTPILPMASSSVRSDFVYRRLEDSLRGSPAEVEASLRPYLAYARQQQPVLDVGCGRGEFLELCKKEGITARGFDTNERSVADLRQKGLAVEALGVPECFAGFSEQSVGSIFASHVVEHLPVEAMIQLFAQAVRVLRGGGYLMIETPNAQTLSVSAADFWRDPTHLAPRHAAALSLMGREFGFEIEEIRTVRPHTESERLPLPSGDSPDLERLVMRLNELLYGDQDLRLVLKKSG